MIKGRVVWLFLMDKVGFWNMRGINDPLKQLGIKDFLSQNRFSVFALLETKVKQENYASVLAACGNVMSYISKYSYARNGRIWVL